MPKEAKGAVAGRLALRLFRSARPALLLGLAAALGYPAAALAGYLGPVQPDCSATAPIRLADSGNCLAFDGHSGLVYPESGTPGDLKVDDSWVSVTGRTDPGFATLAATVRLDHPAQTWLYAGDPGSTSWQAGSDDYWIVDAGRQSLGAAYLTAGYGRTFLSIGKVERTIADLGDDVPFAALSGFDVTDADASVTLPDMPAFGGNAARIISRPFAGHTFGLGIEDLGEDDTAIASWSYELGPVSSHVTMLDPDLFESGLDLMALHAGGSLDIEPFALRGAVATDRGGWWNALLSGEATFGGLSLGATAAYLRDTLLADVPEQVGGAVSATAAFTQNMSMTTTMSWTRDLGAAVDSLGYRMDLHVASKLGHDLALTGDLGISGSGTAGALAAGPFASTALAWSPGGGSVISAGFSRGADGAYSLTTGATRDLP